MRRLIDALLDFTTGRRTIAAVVVFAVGGTALFRFSPYSAVREASGGRPLPEEGLTSPVQLGEFLTGIGATGRELYASFQVWDLLNPLLLGFMGVMLVGWLVVRGALRGTAGRWLIIVPLIAPFADLVENAVIAGSIASFPESSATAQLLPLISGAKFGGLLGTLLVILCLTVVGLRAHRSGLRADAT